MAKYNFRSPKIPKGGYISNYSTPKELFNILNEEFHFTLDVCADESNHKLDRWFGQHNGIFIDGLKMSWAKEICWMNPPYKSTLIRQWTQKAWFESKVNNTIVVALIPASTDASWFWDYCLDSEIRLIKGRVKFNEETQPYGAPFPSMIVIFK